MYSVNTSERVAVTSQVALVVKNLPASAGDPGSIPGFGISPGEGNGNPLQYSCLENPHGQRSLAGYSQWSRKMSDKTERLSTAHIYIYIYIYIYTHTHTDTHKSVHSVDCDPEITGLILFLC